MERERLAAEQSPARPHRTRDSIVARRAGPVSAAIRRASAHPRFLGASQRCSGSGPQTPAPKTSSAPIPCALPTCPGGTSISVQDCPPRFNPAAPLGFLRCPSSGGDFLSGPPPPHHEGRCSVRRRRSPLFFPLTFFFLWKLTEILHHSPPLPILPFLLPPGEAETPAGMVGTSTPSSRHPLRTASGSSRSRFALLNVLHTFSTLEKTWGRAKAEKQCDSRMTSLWP